MSKKKQNKNTDKANSTKGASRRDDGLLSADRLSPGYGALLSLFLLIITLLAFYSTDFIEGLDPFGVDKLAHIGKSHQMQVAEEETGEVSLWNPYIFSGMPSYLQTSSPAFNLDTLFIKFSRILFDWKFYWFLLGALGVFLLMQILGMPWYVASIAAFAFLFFPHFQALIEVGHNTKIRALMLMPMILFTFINFTRKRDLLGLVLLILAMSLQFRTKHYQIIFYTLILIMTVGIHVIVKWLMEGEQKRLYKTLGMFVAGFAYVIVMSAHPLFIAREYTPHSTRGGGAIDINAPESSAEKQAEPGKKRGGVSFEYATRWSFSPAEMMTLIIPRFYGGISSEVYTGDKYPQLKGRQLPTYWGDMPFTQSSEYMGVILLILAAFGLWTYRNDKLIRALFILTTVAILLSFGRHFPVLYKPLFNYLPYFNKFRAPMMIMTLVYFLILIFSMYGLKAILKKIDENDLKALLAISGFMILTALVTLLFSGSFSLSGPNDARLSSNPQVLNMIREIRLEYLQADSIRLIVLVLIFAGLAAAAYYRRIGKNFFLILLLALILFDLISVSHRYNRHIQYTNRDLVVQNHFRADDMDRFLQQDNGFWRLLGLGQLFQSNDLAYRYQLIGGYSAIKPQLIQNIVDNSLYVRDSRGATGINWNVVNMLNGKYILSPGMLPNDNLDLVYQDAANNRFLFENKNVLPRVWFVKNLQKLDSDADILRRLNDPAYDPSVTALFTSDSLSEKNYPGDASARVTEYSPNQITLAINSPAENFLILSETFYPEGWTARIKDSGENLPIQQVNYILRGLEVPGGGYEIVLTFNPPIFQKASTISIVLTYLVYFIIILQIVKMAYLKKKKF